ncbi:hypothetical protein GCM10023347_00190 [Streptomyces chumphonensis]
MPFAGDLAYRFFSPAQHVPQRVDIVRTGKPAGHPDDGDGLRCPAPVLGGLVGGCACSHWWFLSVEGRTGLTSTREGRRVPAG